MGQSGSERWVCTRHTTDENQWFTVRPWRGELRPPAKGAGLKGGHVSSTFVVAVAVWAMEFVHTHTYVGSFHTVTQRRSTHAAFKTLSVIKQAQ